MGGGHVGKMAVLAFNASDLKPNVRCWKLEMEAMKSRTTFLALSHLLYAILSNPIQFSLFIIT